MEKTTLTANTKKNIRVAVLLSISVIFVAVAAAVAVIAASYIGNQNFRETFYSTSSLNVNNRIRVIQISDLHSCTYGTDNSKLIDRVQKLKPDLIIYTGDCVDSHAQSIDSVVSLCTQLADVAPSYYIYGNNEVERYYQLPLTQERLDGAFGFNDSNRDPGKLLQMTDELTEKLEGGGIRVLKNEGDTITVGSTQVDVYGVLTSNPSSFWSYGGDSFYAHIYTNTNNLKITAIHEPTVLEEYTPESWGDLVLAGHTHGGTVNIPMLGPVYVHELELFPARSGHYIYGRYDVQGRPLIVSSGLDNSNLLRINNEPELVIVDINRF